MQEQDRVLLIAQALSGSAIESTPKPDAIAKRAIEVADATIYALETKRLQDGASRVFAKAAREIDQSRQQSAQRSAAMDLIAAVTASAKQAGLNVEPPQGGWSKISLVAGGTPVAYLGVDGSNNIAVADHVPTTAMPGRVVAAIRFDPDDAQFKSQNADASSEEMIAFALTDILRK